MIETNGLGMCIEHFGELNHIQHLLKTLIYLILLDIYIINQILNVLQSEELIGVY
jgi:hypothetical protein